MAIDLSQIPFDPSPNYSKGRKDYKYIVIHTPDGFYEGSLTWMKNPKSQVSAHYLLGQKGQIVQLVKLENTAWHCYGINRDSIGLELEDKRMSAKNPDWITPVMWNNAVSICAALCKKHNIQVSNIIGHNTPWVQKMAVQGGHPGYVHSDPGKFFSMDKFRDAVSKELEGHV